MYHFISHCFVYSKLHKESNNKLDMSYRLKKIQYFDRDVHILLQNENGPCPLIAASNCLLLKGSVTFPPQTVRNGVTSLDDITNLLANYAMIMQQRMHESLSSTNDSSTFESDTQNQFSLNEFMNLIPNFQYGMDVNPKFNMGCLGFEYTAELNVLSDMLGCKLVHGWLIDPIQDEATALAVGSKSYNELVDQSVVGKEAELQVSQLQVEIEKVLFQLAISNTSNVGEVNHHGTVPDSIKENLNNLRKQQSEMQDIAIAAHLLDAFLASSSHQLTTYGLEQLYETISDREIAILFRNNHFSTIARHGEFLYVLVTDLGFANTPSIIWEKLDVVDGDAEFCDCFFICNQHAPIIDETDQRHTLNNSIQSSEQNDVDYQLAVQLSLQRDNNEVNNATITAGTIAVLPCAPDKVRVEVGTPIFNTDTPECTTETADHLLAQQLQRQQDVIHSEIDRGNDEASLRLIRQIQKEESESAQISVASRNNHMGTRDALISSNTGRQAGKSTPLSSNCVIM